MLGRYWSIDLSNMILVEFEKFIYYVLARVVFKKFMKFLNVSAQKAFLFLLFSWLT